MNSDYNLQDVLRCQLCETPVPHMYCDICKLNLCKPCVGEHLSDESTEHKVVPFRKRGSTLCCTEHPTKLCELHCEQCDIPICVQCVSSGEHLGHKQSEILKCKESLNEALQKDLKELEKLFYPKHQEIASNISVQKAAVRENCKLLKTTLDKQGENLHREIDNAIRKLKTEVNEMESKHLVDLDKQEDEIKRSLSEIKQIIADGKKILNPNDVRRVSSYKSSIAKYRWVPPKITVPLPSLTPQNINKKQIYQMFGSLSSVSIPPETYGYISDFTKTLTSPWNKTQLKDKEDMGMISVGTSSPYAPQSYPAYVKRNPNKALELGSLTAQIQVQHKSQEDEIQQYACPKCDQTYSDFDTLQIHVLDCIDQDM